MAPRFPHNPVGQHPGHPRRHHPESGAAGSHQGGDIVSDVADIVSDVKDVFSGTFGGLAGGLGTLIDIGRQFFANAPETPIIDAGLKVINGMTEMCGDGNPDTGEGFANGADEFSDIGESLRSAAPDDSWTGGSASAYTKQNVKQQSRMQSLADTDSSIAQVLAQEAEQLGVTVQQLNSAATTLQLAILPASIAMADPLGGEAASVAIQIAAVASGMAIATPAMANMASNSMQNAQSIQRAANSYRDVASKAKLDGAQFFSPSAGGSQPRPQEPDSPLWTTNHTPLGTNATPSTGASTTSGGSGGSPGVGAGSSRGGGAPVNSESGTVTPAGMSTGSPGGLLSGLPSGSASGAGQSGGLLSGLGGALGWLIGQAAQQGAQAAQNAQNQKAQDPEATGEDESDDKQGRDLEKEDDANKEGEPESKPEDAELAGVQTGPGTTGERAPIHFEFDMDREQVSGPVTVTLDPDHPTAAPIVSHPPTQQV